MDETRRGRGGYVPGARLQADRDDMVTTALRPLVDQPAVMPRPVADVAAAARRRRVRRRSLATVAGAVLLVAVAGLASAFDSPPAVTTVDQPSEPSVTGPTPSSTDEPSTTAGEDTTASTAPSTSSTGATTTDTPPDPAGTTTGEPDRPHDPIAGIEAEAADETSGATTALPGSGPDGGGTSLRMGDGSRLLFQDVDFAAGPATGFEVVVACADIPTTLHVRLDDPTSAPVATVHITSTGGWARFTTATVDTASTLGGRHDVYLTVDAGADGPAVAVDRLRFLT